MKLWKYSGTYLTATGALHTVVALVLFRDAYRSMFENGLVNSTGGNYERASAFWFFICGIFLILLGTLLQHYIKTTQRPVPGIFGYSLLVVSIIGCIVIPVSGFWLFIPQALIIIFASRKFIRARYH